MQRFRDVIFVDGRFKLRECAFRLLFADLFFVVCQSTAKNAKISVYTVYT